jgi:hypothetical protein
VFSLSAGGEPTTNWTTPEWEAEDATGNRGQTLGLHEPMLKFIATTYPKPEAVIGWYSWSRSTPRLSYDREWGDCPVLSGLPCSLASEVKRNRPTTLAQHLGADLIGLPS